MLGWLCTFPCPAKPPLNVQGLSQAAPRQYIGNPLCQWEPRPPSSPAQGSGIQALWPRLRCGPFEQGPSRASWWSRPLKGGSSTASVCDGWESSGCLIRESAWLTRKENCQGRGCGGVGLGLSVDVAASLSAPCCGEDGPRRPAAGGPAVLCFITREAQLSPLTFFFFFCISCKSSEGSS